MKLPDADSRNCENAVTPLQETSRFSHSILTVAPDSALDLISPSAFTRLSFRCFCSTVLALLHVTLAPELSFKSRTCKILKTASRSALDPNSINDTFVGTRSSRFPLCTRNEQGDRYLDCPAKPCSNNQPYYANRCRQSCGLLVTCSLGQDDSADCTTPGDLETGDWC